MAPGKSFELNSTCEPGRSSACSVNGANTPTQSNCAAGERGGGGVGLDALEVDVVLGQPVLARPCRSRKWSTTPASAAIDLALEVLDRR